MFHNYFFLKRLASRLNDKLTGLELLECFSQNKDELILGFADKEKTYYIRANLDPIISLLQVTDSYARAGKNSIDLFKELIGLKVLGIAVFEYERSFMINLELNQTLVFKMHSRRANILLLRDDQVIDTFRKKLSQDFELTSSTLHNSISITKENFEAHDADPIKMIPALGKETKIHLQRAGFFEMDKDKRWSEMLKLLRSLETNPIFLHDAKNPRVSLLQESETSTSDPIYATNWLYENTTRVIFLEREKDQIRNQIKQNIKKSENYISKTKQKLIEQKSSRNPEEIANIIMANLNALQTGLSKAVLHDFYTNQPITIKLNTSLSPQKNAEQYYRKSKNRHQEIDALKQNISAKESLIEKLSRQLLSLEEIDNHKELRRYRKNQQPDRSAKQKATLPYHEHELDGWKILVGKNSKANDELTLKVANKNDLWLHAKDVAGSHVVVKEKPGQNFPEYVIEFAASLAAANSKRKTDSVCPVIYTPKKFVRKSKGSPAGQVIVEKEMVLMVEPYGT